MCVNCVPLSNKLIGFSYSCTDINNNKTNESKNCEFENLEASYSQDTFNVPIIQGDFEEV